MTPTKEMIDEVFQEVMEYYIENDLYKYVEKATSGEWSKPKIRAWCEAGIKAAGANYADEYIHKKLGAMKYSRAARYVFAKQGKGGHGADDKATRKLAGVKKKKKNILKSAAIFVSDNAAVIAGAALILTGAGTGAGAALITSGAKKLLKKGETYVDKKTGELKESAGGYMDETGNYVETGQDYIDNKTKEELSNLDKELESIGEDTGNINLENNNSGGFQTNNTKSDTGILKKTADAGSVGFAMGGCGATITAGGWIILIPVAAWWAWRAYETWKA